MRKSRFSSTLQLHQLLQQRVARRDDLGVGLEGALGRDHVEELGVEVHVRFLQGAGGDAVREAPCRR